MHGINLTWFGWLSLKSQLQMPSRISTITESIFNVIPNNRDQIPPKKVHMNGEN
jgi:hypothetical protein